MSVRDQRVGTSYSDKVKEDVSQEYFTLSKQTYTLDVLCHGSDELGGLVEILLQEEIVNVK